MLILQIAAGIIIGIVGLLMLPLLIRIGIWLLGIGIVVTILSAIYLIDFSDSIIGTWLMLGILSFFLIFIGNIYINKEEHIERKNNVDY